ncbi:MAG TPA: type II toxin-antitoxin system VapC family toxin [Thermoanaerobaculia bacterium]|nr:type II toxin-antitoxin system VapC family toxin [Thermoanaerobaculia bacterium]
MIFVDSNIPMYLVGSPHPNKIAAEQTVAALVSRREKLVSDAEVLQEILHRYAAISRLDAIQPAFDALLGLVDEVFPIEPENVQRAKTVLLGKYRLSARDAIHLAVMEQHGVQHILTFDQGFDRYPNVRRVTNA